MFELHLILIENNELQGERGQNNLVGFIKLIMI